uniref:Uncharacterized protein n=1 Tax=Arundo donax TaxID=35708 RepID=A0A0A9AWG2_ARUDO
MTGWNGFRSCLMCPPMKISAKSIGVVMFQRSGWLGCSMSCLACL